MIGHSFRTSQGRGRGAAPLRKWVGLSKMGKCWAQTQRAAHSWANGSAVRADLNPEGSGGCSTLSQLLASWPGRWDQYSSPDSGARRRSLYAEQFENLLTARDRREWERQAHTHTSLDGFQSQLITERERELWSDILCNPLRGREEVICLLAK